MHAHSSKFSNPSKIYQSSKLSWLERKIRDVLNHYKIYNDFSEDKRNTSKSPLKRLNNNHLKYILSEIEKYRSLSIRKISRLLKDHFQNKVSKVKISQALIDN